MEVLRNNEQAVLVAPHVQADNTLSLIEGVYDNATCGLNAC